jgi:hypothetical protein
MLLSNLIIYTHICCRWQINARRHTLVFQRSLLRWWLLYTWGRLIIIIAVVQSVLTWVAGRRSCLLIASLHNLLSWLKVRLYLMICLLLIILILWALVLIIIYVICIFIFDELPIGSTIYLIFTHILLLIILAIHGLIWWNIMISLLIIGISLWIWFILVRLNRLSLGLIICLRRSLIIKAYTRFLLNIILLL